MYPLPPNAKYVTPHGTGDHSGTSWSNAYSIQDLKHRLASNTSFYFTDSTFLVDSIVVNNFTNISFIGKGKDKTILEGIDVGNVESIINWSIKCFDILNSSNTTIKDLQIRRFRRWGIRVGSTSNNFLGHNLYIDSCGWTAVSGDPPVQEIASPCGVKLIGDDGIFRKSYIMQSGWDGMQVAGYRVLIDTTTIYATGQDEPDALQQGDGIGSLVNPDSFYYVHTNGDSVKVWKTAQFTVRKCNINTVVDRKSGIEAGEKPPEKHSEKPLVQIYDSIISGGKGVGITQDAHPRIGNFYSSIEKCTIQSLNPDRYTLRVESWDSGTSGWIRGNRFISPADYNPLLLCPVGEYDTDSIAVNYPSNTNRWFKGLEEFDFCVTHNLITP